MSWFDRYADDDVEGALLRLDALLARSGLVDALTAASGPHGLRRFLVRVELRAGRMRVTALESTPLPAGGGAPAPATFDAHARALEAAVLKLRASLPEAHRFTHAALGFVRDGDGQAHVTAHFDEDADALALSELATPGGEPWPPEDPAYQRALAAWDSRMATVRTAWELAPAGEAWSVENGRLLRPGNAPAPVVPLATLDGEAFRWLLEQPAGDEAPLTTPELIAPLATAAGMVLLAAARLGCRGVFQGTLDGGALFFAGIR